MAGASYVAVAVMWLVPDRRIERPLHSSGAQETATECGNAKLLVNGGPVPTTDAIDERDDKTERKRRDKYDEGRLLEPWDQYRVLNDMAKLQMDLMEMADRRTRFALLILGTLNALNILIVARPDLLGQAGVQVSPVPGAAAYVVVYAGLSLFLFVKAVVALKPRATPLLAKREGADRRLRHFGAIISQSTEEYLQGWREATIGSVLQELAFHVQLSARVVSEKYTAIGQLYLGLMLLVLLTAGMLTVVVIRILLASA
jgi:hypothetical protein